MVAQTLAPDPLAMRASPYTPIVPGIVSFARAQIFRLLPGRGRGNRTGHRGFGRTRIPCAILAPLWQIPRSSTVLARCLTMELISMVLRFNERRATEAAARFLKLGAAG